MTEGKRPFPDPASDNKNLIRSNQPGRDIYHNSAVTSGIVPGPSLHI
ncbi:MAG: hypothetical protein IPJ94_03920 [Chloroflexi bacterium]|nr:hypothetical protein [Chloroflexota bacterium]